MVRRIALCMLSSLLYACVVGQMMTSSSFGELRAGMTMAEVEQQVGKPWELRPQGSFVEAVYCERWTWRQQSCETQYLLLYEQGRLVSKRRFYQERPSPERGAVNF